MRNLRISSNIALVVGTLAACATAPKTSGERHDLEASANATFQAMLQKDPALNAVMTTSAGYAVFPSIGKGGFIVGGAYGRGVMYEHGRPTGYVELNQGSLGAQIGGQTFSELVVLRSPYDVARLKAGKFSIGGNVSAVALTAGAAAGADFSQGVAVFVMKKGGLMAELSVSGQQINFEPRGG